MVREGPPQPAPPPKRPPDDAGEKVRGGAIVLRTRARRIIFIAGLAGAVVLALLLAVLTGTR